MNRFRSADLPFSVDFVPGAVGARSSGSAGTRRKSLFMDGTGTDPDFTIEPATRDFGTRLTDKGPGTRRPSPLTSTGTTDLELGAAALAGAASTSSRSLLDACSNQTLPRRRRRDRGGLSDRRRRAKRRPNSRFRSPGSAHLGAVDRFRAEAGPSPDPARRSRSSGRSPTSHQSKALNIPG